VQVQKVVIFNTDHEAKSQIALAQCSTPITSSVIKKENEHNYNSKGIKKLLFSHG
jgi:hypothetical protein